MRSIQMEYDDFVVFEDRLAARGFERCADRIELFVRERRMMIGDLPPKEIPGPDGRLDRRPLLPALVLVQDRRVESEGQQVLAIERAR